MAVAAAPAAIVKAMACAVVRGSLFFACIKDYLAYKNSVLYCTRYLFSVNILDWFIGWAEQRQVFQKKESKH